MYYRLPIIQGGTFSFFVPTFAILSLPGFVCPEDFDMKNRKWTRSNMTYDEKTEEWQIRMREIQGAICVSAIFQVVMGFSGRRFSIRIDEIQLIIILIKVLFRNKRIILHTILTLGLMGLILRFITPLTITPAVAMIGIALFEAASGQASSHWGIAMG